MVALSVDGMLQTVASYLSTQTPPAATWSGVQAAGGGGVSAPRVANWSWHVSPTGTMPAPITRRYETGGGATPGRTCDSSTAFAAFAAPFGLKGVRRKRNAMSSIATVVLCASMVQPGSRYTSN